MQRGLKHTKCFLVVIQKNINIIIIITIIIYVLKEIGEHICVALSESDRARDTVL